ncbi:MAG: 16S rRNA (uracil(1498)-N(3))-methyltransferase [Oscillospiraceae bacterium]
MPRFFTNEIDDNKAYIKNDDAKHIKKVLRMKIGDTIDICDTNGYDYMGIISELSDGLVCVDLLEKSLSKSEPNINLTLYQAVPKGDKMEFIIQKATELGAAKIVPVVTKYCVSRPDEKSAKKKTERYQRIALEAAKQSQRGKIPVIENQIGFEQAISEMGKSQHSIIFYEKATDSFENAIKKASENNKDISIMIGSEGGFSEEEIAWAMEKGIQIVSLGNRILRCETAPLTAISIIMYETGNI